MVLVFNRVRLVLTSIVRGIKTLTKTLTLHNLFKLKSRTTGGQLMYKYQNVSLSLLGFQTVDSAKKQTDMFHENLKKSSRTCLNDIGGICLETVCNTNI
jgi:hypothetical protein